MYIKNASAGYYKNHPFLSLTILVISMFIVFLTSTISFTFSSQNVLAQNSAPNNLPDAKSVSDTGKMVLPSSVSGFIIALPDETHEDDNHGQIINPSNSHYLPANTVIPSGTAIAFAGGDPNHVHSEILTDTSGNSIWTTTSFPHPGASDSKVLPPGTYTITDFKYTPMKGTVTEKPNVKSLGNLVAGVMLLPPPSLKIINHNLS